MVPGIRSYFPLLLVSILILFNFLCQPFTSFLKYAVSLKHLSITIIVSPDAPINLTMDMAVNALLHLGTIHEKHIRYIKGALHY